MNKDEKPSDECISNAQIQAIHNLMARNGAIGALNDLLERENALGAYVIFSGHQISEIVRISGAPPSLVKRVQEAVVTHALVCIEAQDQAHYGLWRDLMGDPALDGSREKRNEEPKGDDHGG